MAKKTAKKQGEHSSITVKEIPAEFGGDDAVIVKKSATSVITHRDGKVHRVYFSDGKEISSEVIK